MLYCKGNGYYVNFDSVNTFNKWRHLESISEDGAKNWVVLNTAEHECGCITAADVATFDDDLAAYEASEYEDIAQGLHEVITQYAYWEDEDSKYFIKK